MRPTYSLPKFRRRDGVNVAKDGGSPIDEKKKRWPKTCPLPPVATC